MKVKCDQCKKIFNKTPYHVEHSKHNFCKRKCKDKYEKENQVNKIHLPITKHELKKLYVEKTVCEMAEMFNISTATMCRRLKEYNISRIHLARTIPNMKPTFELGWLCGAIMGDGNISSNGYTCALIGTNKELMNIFAKTANNILPSASIDISKRKNTHRKKICYRARFSSKAFYTYLKPFKPSPYRWTIPSFLTSKISICGFICGLFDTDGCIVCGDKIQLSLTSKYDEGLKQVKKHLEKLHILSNICREKARLVKIDGKTHISSVYYLKIYDKHSIKNFGDKINFKHPNKRKKLKDAISSLIFETYDLQKYYLALKLRKDMGMGYRKIAKILGISRGLVSGWIYNNSKPPSIRWMEKVSMVENR